MSALRGVALGSAFVGALMVAGCGGEASVKAEDASTPPSLDSSSPFTEAQADVGSETNTGADARSDAGEDAAEADAQSCVLSDGGRSTCAFWRCCREGEPPLGIEVLCVPMDAGCPGPP